MDYPWAERLGEVARENDIALSVHAPLFAFPGHPDEKKAQDGASARSTAAPGSPRRAAPRSWSSIPASGSAATASRRSTTSSAGSGQLREHLEQKNRAVTFGIEVMGRVSELGSIDDTLDIAERVAWVRPVIDFAHMHATSDGAFTDTEAFAAVLEAADAVLEPGAPFHIHFSDIAYANRNETKHLPYGEGTLRAEPLRDALARFDRPATVISESPDEASTQAIRAALGLMPAP